jgi:hypothetical protein
VHLGTLAPRGERNVLIASLDSLLLALESVLSLHDEKGRGDLSVHTGLFSLGTWKHDD